jgi:uncharacterized protein YjiS (DUF1127 family)
MNAIATLFHSLAARRQYVRLQQLDDYLLTDIGLTRSDLRQLTSGDRTAHAPSGR